MDKEINIGVKNYKMNKKLLFGGLGGAIVLAGGVAAYTLLNSPKEAYLYAEYKTANSAIEQLEQRFEQDIKWADIVKTDATKMDMELSASVEDYYGYMDYEVLEAINSSSIDLTVHSDPKENTYALSAGATIFDFTIDPFTAYLTDKKIVGEMPFQEEALELNLEKLFDLSNEELNNACISDADVERLIKQRQLLSEDDLKHLQKEILPEIYKSIPDEAFEKEGDQLTLQLTGRDIEKLINVAANTLAQDKVVKRFVSDTIKLSGECEYYTVEEALDEMLADVSEIDVDPSVTIKSVITVDGSQILERKLYVEDELLLEGTQNFKDRIVFDYDFMEPGYGVIASIKGEIGTGKEIRDEIEISAEGETFFYYEGNETNGKSVRDFSRALTVYDGYDEFTFNWDGSQSFAGDGNVSDNEIYVEIPGEGILSLNLKTNSQKTKGIKLPRKTIDLTDMSTSEIERYFENEVADNFMYWAEDLAYELEDLFYYY